MSENTPKQITTYNSNRKMSKNNSKNKILNYNIDYSNMTSKETLEQKIEKLKEDAENVKNADLKEKVDNLIQLYKDRKLSRITTVKNQIKNSLTMTVLNQEDKKQ